MFQSLKNNTKSFFSKLASLPSLLLNQISKLKNDFLNLRYKLKNITRSNINLGQFHIKSGNYKDAVFRFKLITGYLEPANEEAHFLLGLSYFLLKKYDKAKIHLELGRNYDRINLMNITQNINIIDYLPRDISRLFRDIKAKNYIDNYASNRYNLPQEMIIELNNAITQLPDEYRILEIGSNVGLLGYEIRKRMQESYELHSIEISSDMLQLQTAFFGENNFYDKLINSSPEDFIAKNKDSYDIIISLNGLSYRSNLQEIFGKIYKILNNNGYFAFAFKVANEGRFSGELLEFSYNYDQIIQKLEETNFKILQSKKFLLESNNNYIIVICNK